MEATNEAKNRAKGEGSIYQKSDTGVWMFSIMHNGKRLTRSLKTTDEQEALKNLKKVRNNFLGRIDRGELEPSTEANVTLDELLTDYTRHVKQNSHKSARIIELVINKVRKAKEFGNGEKATRKVGSLTTTDFERYRTRLVETEESASHSTVNNHFAYIRAALYLETKRTPSRVAKVPHIPIVRVNNRRLGFIEYDAHEYILAALPRSIQALFVIAFHSGCRLGEILAMRWSHVDWTNKIIRLPESKNGSQRNLPFWGSVEEYLTRQKTCRDENYPEQERLFFWMAEDTELSHGGRRNLPGTPVEDFRGSWTNAVTEAHRLRPSEIPADLLFHDLRRSAVRVMIQDAGIPEAQAMLISGHETRSMLERYNIVSLKNVQDAGAKLHAWAKERKAKRRPVRKVVAKGSKQRRRTA
ncbi:MAG TPA: tyrosine-type recombinase/integrase [Bryobacteraceae bacterium]|jgi:integrase